MSKLKNALRAIKVYNNFEMLTRFGGADDLAVEYHPYVPRILSGYCSIAWSIKSAHEALDVPNFRMCYHPHKWFGGSKKETFKVAVAFAEGVTGEAYAPSPFGGYLPVTLLKKAKASIGDGKDEKAVL